MAKIKWVQVAVAGLVGLGIGMAGMAGLVNVPNAEEIARKVELPTMPTAEEIAEKVVVDVPTAVGEFPEEIVEKIDKLYEDAVADDVWEVAAEELAKAELDERRFKKDLAEFLGLERKDYDDITKIKVRDVEVGEMDVDDKDAFVELKLKVYYDTDEEDDLKAKVLVAVEIEDGEVVDYEFE